MLDCWLSSVNDKESQVLGQFEFRSELIPKGFKLIAVGERRATPTELPTKRFLTLKGSNCATPSVTPSGSESLYDRTRGRRGARPRLLT